MVGLGLAAGVGAIVVAVKETPKCLYALEEAEKEVPMVTQKLPDGTEVEIPDEIELKTKLLIIAKHYGLAFALECMSFIMIIWGTKIRLDWYAGLFAAYGLKKVELDDLKKVISEQPANWQKKFVEARAESHLKDSDPKDIPEPRMSNTEVPMPLPLYFDDQAKVYFRMSEADLRDAIADFTELVSTDPFQSTSMNDWMRTIDHEDVVNGDYYLMAPSGIDGDGALKYQQIGVKEAPNGEPARMMRFSKDYHLDARGLYSNV